MPPPRAGRALIWLVLCFLCSAVFVGGGFLVAYVVLPESQSSSWYGIAGLTLVCLPWLFWFLTCFYRLISRACGIRLGHPVADDSVVASNNVADEGIRSDDYNERSTMNKSSGGKRVHFGEAVVVNENENENEKDGSGRGEMSGTTRSSSSSRSSYSNGSDESVENVSYANVI